MHSMFIMLTKNVAISVIITVRTIFLFIKPSFLSKSTIKNADLRMQKHTLLRLREILVHNVQILCFHLLKTKMVFLLYIFHPQFLYFIFNESFYSTFFFFKKINYKTMIPQLCKIYVAMQIPAWHTVMLNVFKLINKHINDEGFNCIPRLPCYSIALTEKKSLNLCQ